MSTRCRRYVRDNQSTVSVVMSVLLMAVSVSVAMFFFGISGHLGPNVSETTLNLFLGCIYLFSSLAFALYCFSTSSDKTSW
ncbi:MAG: hypothetical protein V1716_04615 [Candidatus Uhrbacteria bacterium]